jgi:hypothetical protein
MKSILTKVALMAVLLALMISCRPSENSESRKANSLASPAATATPTVMSGSSKQSVNESAGASESNSGEDRVAAQSDLNEAKRELLRYTLNGKSKEAADLLTDDYKNVRPDGTVEDKSQYLAKLKPLEGLDTFLVSEFKVASIQGDTAAIAGLVQVRAKGKDFRSKFKETFVRRQGKWLLRSSENTEMEPDN